MATLGKINAQVAVAGKEVFAGSIPYQFLVVWQGQLAIAASILRLGGHVEIIAESLGINTACRREIQEIDRHKTDGWDL